MMQFVEVYLKRLRNMDYTCRRTVFIKGVRTIQDDRHSLQLFV